MDESGNNGSIFGAGGIVEPSSELGIFGLPIDSPVGTGTGTGDGSSGAGSGVDGEPRKRRGRPPGAGNTGTGTRSKASSQNGLGIETLLFNIHTMLAAVVGAPEMALDKEESKMLGDAIATVNSYYNSVLDPKVVAWINLGGVVAAVYGPRAFMLRQRFRDRKPKPPTQPDDTVIQFSGIMG